MNDFAVGDAVEVSVPATYHRTAEVPSGEVPAGETVWLPGVVRERHPDGTYRVEVETPLLPRDQLTQLPRARLRRLGA